ncbi:MAG: Lipopolysaccharide transferase family protein [Patescibacteria group bacterium]|nr:Lipopolysaccharide transferase family protein [Patescibacteria group bacterium]
MNILKRFESTDTVLAITSYPNDLDSSRGKKEFNAVAWHSQKTLMHLSGLTKVVVFAEKRTGKKFFQPNDSLIVQRMWEKGNIFSLLLMLKQILRLPKIKNIFVQFEFNVFGGILPNLILLLNLAILRLFRKHITFELHQVITDISLLQKHIHITHPLLQTFFNISLGLFYRLLGFIAQDIIVFEEELKTRLSRFVKEDKIHVLSLAVDSKKTIPSKKARQAVALPQKDFTLLVFGFINGYKGIDWIIEKLKGLEEKNVRLIIAGGENPYLKDKKHYQDFYKNIVNEAQKYSHVTLTGFVPDEKVHEYFSAADLVLMPYEVFMAASGPFSLALSYQKPLLLSNVLKDYAKSHDFSAALNHAQLKEKDIFFSLKNNDLLTLIEKAQKDSAYRKKLHIFMKELATLRSSTTVVARLFSILTKTNTSLSSVLQEEKSLSIR